MPPKLNVPSQISRTNMPPVNAVEGLPPLLNQYIPSSTIHTNTSTNNYPQVSPHFVSEVTTPRQLSPQHQSMRGSINQQQLSCARQTHSTNSIKNNLQAVNSLASRCNPITDHSVTSLYHSSNNQVAGFTTKPTDKYTVLHPHHSHHTESQVQPYKQKHAPTSQRNANRYGNIISIYIYIYIYKYILSVYSPFPLHNIPSPFLPSSLLLLLYALFNHPRLLIQVARVQKAQFSYRLDGLVP